jgi:hypothetical protein
MSLKKNKKIGLRMTELIKNMSCFNDVVVLYIEENTKGSHIIQRRGEKVVAVSGYWPKPLTTTVWAVSGNRYQPPPTANCFFFFLPKP